MINKPTLALPINNRHEINLAEKVRFCEKKSPSLRENDRAPGISYTLNQLRNLRKKDSQPTYWQGAGKQLCGVKKYVETTAKTHFNP